MGLELISLLNVKVRNLLRIGSQLILKQECLTTEKERIVSEMDKLQKQCVISTTFFHVFDHRRINSNEFLETRIKSYDQVLLEKGVEVQKLKQINSEFNYMNHLQVKNESV